MITERELFEVNLRRDKMDPDTLIYLADEMELLLKTTKWEKVMTFFKGPESYIRGWISLIRLIADANRNINQGEMH